MALQHAHEHICAHTGIHTSMHMFKHEPKFMYIHMSVHEHVRGHRYVEVGVPTLAQQGGGDGEAARNIIHTLARQYSSFEINRSTMENIH